MSGEPDLTQRPSLEFQYAFDICAVQAQRLAGDHGCTVVLLSEHPFFVRELAKRLPGISSSIPEWESAPCVVICPTSQRVGPDQLRRLLPEGAALIEFRFNLLARALPEVKSGLLSTRDIAPWFRPHAGFECIARFGFHSLASTAWWHAGQWMGRIGRPDIADRLQARMRAAFALRGLRSFMAPVQLYVYRRTS